MRIRAIHHKMFRILRLSKSFLIDEGGLVLMDASPSKSSSRDVAEALKEWGQTPSSIEMCILTHRHFDHTGGLAALSELCGFRVACHALEAEAIMRATGVEVDLEFEDGDVLPECGGLRVVHVSRYMAGNICILAGKNLIPGDTFRGGRTRLKPPLSRFSENYLAAVKNLSKLEELNFDSVYVSHGKDITAGGKEQVSALINRLSEVREFHNIFLKTTSDRFP